MVLINELKERIARVNAHLNLHSLSKPPSFFAARSMKGNTWATLMWRSSLRRAMRIRPCTMPRLNVPGTVAQHTNVQQFWV